MKKLTLLTFAAATILLFADSSFAQDGYNGYEVFAGYSHSRIDTAAPGGLILDNATGPEDDDFFLDDVFDDRIGAHGFEVSFTGNFNRYVGVKTSVSGHFREVEFGFQNFSTDVDTALWNTLVGVQVKDNTKDDDARFKPFGHVLVGSAYARQEFNNNTGSTFRDSKFTEHGFAGAFGGGIDVRVGEDVDIRVIQVDYNPTWLFDEVQHNFRVGIGIVFH
jgi:hypothetical protein